MPQQQLSAGLYVFLFWTTLEDRIIACIEEEGITGILSSSSPVTLRTVPGTPQVLVAIQFSET